MLLTLSHVYKTPGLGLVLTVKAKEKKQSYLKCYIVRGSYQARQYNKHNLTPLFTVTSRNDGFGYKFGKVVIYLRYTSYWVDKE